MRLNADLISKSAQYLNPLNQFHLDLRGYKLPYLENLSASNDQFACIDLTDNDIAKLEELPQLLRLETLMLGNNRISRIQKDFAQMCPRLDTLILSSNRIASLQEIDNLPQNLKRLILLENVVCNLSNYRLYVIWRLPSLKMLDYQKVTKAEKELAANTFKKTENLAKVQQQAVQVSEVLYENQMAPELKEALIALDRALEEAETIEEIQDIEKKIKLLRNQ